jgi:hypothetical protein
VDSSDDERLGEAKEELHRIIKEDALANVIVLIFANKQVAEFAPFKFVPANLCIPASCRSFRVMEAAGRLRSVSTSWRRKESPRSPLYLCLMSCYAHSPCHFLCYVLC